jgi:hypothetical protein
VNLYEQRTESYRICYLLHREHSKAYWLNPRDLLLELRRTDGIEHFLYPSYQTLHTQGKEYIIDEVLEYIHKHNPDFTTKRTA